VPKVVIFRAPDAAQLRDASEWLVRLGRPHLQLELSCDPHSGILLIIHDYKHDQVAVDRLFSKGSLEFYDSWDARLPH
jgi:xanthine/CO dehydrogenase XdhC/CoxF family maturation factor